MPFIRYQLQRGTSMTSHPGDPERGQLSSVHTGGGDKERGEEEEEERRRPQHLSAKQRR